MSRFPIIESEFDPYPYGVVSDALSYKGVLYAKILIHNKHVLHLFNTHTQASYFHDDLETFVNHTFFTNTFRLGRYFGDKILVNKVSSEVHRKEDCKIWRK